jgi:integrase
MTIGQALRRASTTGNRFEIGPTKTTNSLRTVRLSPTAIRALKAHQKKQKQQRLASTSWTDTGLVFTSSGGAAIDPSNLRRRWEALCKRADLEGVTLHQLRHTAGSHAVDSGMAITEVADNLGHDPETLMRHYRGRTRPVAEGVSDVMERLVTNPLPT